MPFCLRPSPVSPQPSRAERAPSTRIPIAVVEVAQGYELLASEPSPATEWQNRIICLAGNLVPFIYECRIQIKSGNGNGSLAGYILARIFIRKAVPLSSWANRK
jgi:hypothetical protein